MKRFIFKLLLVILLLCGLFYIDSYHPFVVVLICLIISLITMPFLATRDEWESDTWLVCISLWVASGFYLYRGYQTIPWEKDRVALVPPFYPIFGEVIAVGERVDTIDNVPKCFISDDGDISTVQETVFLLHLDSTSSLLFNSCNIILERGRNLLFEPRYFRYGWLLTISFLDDYNVRRYIDLLGKDITTKNYEPSMTTIPSTPDYY